MKRIKLLTGFTLVLPMYVGFLKFIVGVSIGVPLYSCTPYSWLEERDRRKKEENDDINNIINIFCKNDKIRHDLGSKEAELHSFAKEKIYYLLLKDYGRYEDNNICYELCKILNQEKLLLDSSYKDLPPEIKKSIISEFRDFIIDTINKDKLQNINEFFNKYTEEGICKKLRELKTKNSTKQN